jgi:CRP/FNR family transcriptional regulator, cyclic AMP receptor protein
VLDSDLTIRYANQTVADSDQGSILDARMPWSAAGWSTASPYCWAAGRAGERQQGQHRMSEVRVVARKVRSTGVRCIPSRQGGPTVKRKAKLPFDPKAFLSKVNGGRAISKYRKDQIVYSQGESADSVFYIQSGKVKTTVVSQQGKEAVVSLLETGNFFGEGCLTGQSLRLATVTTMTESVIVRITKLDITRVIHEEPAFAELFIAHLLARNLRVEEDLVDQLFNSSEKRLARVLLLLANFGKEGRPEPIIAKISQETLAEMIGTTRARVSFFMNKFRQLGLIDYNGHIEVHSSLLNLVLHDQPQIKT